MTPVRAYLATLPGRCEHGLHLATQGCADCGQERKADVLAAVNESADPDFRARIDAAIRSAAALGKPFSANDLRAAFSDVPGPLVGARFNAAAKAGVIEHVGYVPSTKGNTHAHDIKLWKGTR